MGTESLFNWLALRNNRPLIMKRTRRGRFDCNANYRIAQITNYYCELIGVWLDMMSFA